MSRSAVPWAPTLTCREFRGMDRGFCPNDPTVLDANDQGFCGRHAVARKVDVAGAAAAPVSLADRVAP